MLCVKCSAYMCVVCRIFFLSVDSLKIKKTNECAQHFSEISFIWYAQSQKIAKPNNLDVFGSIITKGSKQNSQNIRLRWSMSEGGEPQL